MSTLTVRTGYIPLPPLCPSRRRSLSDAAVTRWTKRRLARVTSRVTKRVETGAGIARRSGAGGGGESRCKRQRLLASGGFADASTDGCCMDSDFPRAQLSDCAAMGSRAQTGKMPGRRGASPQASEPIRRHGICSSDGLVTVALLGWGERVSRQLITEYRHDVDRIRFRVGKPARKRRSAKRSRTCSSAGASPPRPDLPGRARISDAHQQSPLHRRRARPLESGSRSAIGKPRTPTTTSTRKSARRLRSATRATTSFMRTRARQSCRCGQSAKSPV